MKTLQPYDKILDPQEGARSALRELVQQGELSRRGTYVYVNNRLEGNAPGTIEAILGLDG